MDSQTRTAAVVIDMWREVYVGDYTIVDGTVRVTLLGKLRRSRPAPKTTKTVPIGSRNPHTTALALLAELIEEAKGTESFRRETEFAKTLK